MSLKLFQVNIESKVVVLAKNAKSAENMIGEGYGEIDAHEILEGCLASAREITKLKELDSYWKEADPYISKIDRNNKANDYLINLTCEEILKKHEAEEKERIRLKEIEDKFDKSQMKLPFKEDINVVICNSCWYSGAIDTFDPCFSAYNDIRCPKCGSTNNEHNSKYQEEICENMKKCSELNKPKGNI